MPAAKPTKVVDGVDCKECFVCKQYIPLPKIFSGRCKECAKTIRARRRISHPEATKALDKNQKLKMQHNITLVEFQEMYEKQNGVCAICKCPESAVIGRGPAFLSVDHDHSCCPENGRSCGNCVRGLLCFKCNMAIGLMKDDKERLLRLLAYVKND